MVHPYKGETTPAERYVADFTRPIIHHLGRDYDHYEPKQAFHVRCSEQQGVRHTLAFAE